MNHQRRAKPGGEYGANGEWYEGGQWIANTDHPKNNKKKYTPSRRQEIAPWFYEVPPEGKSSLYATWSGTWEKCESGFRCRTDLPVDYWGEDYLKESEAMAQRWNSGERWIDGDCFSINQRYR